MQGASRVSVVARGAVFTHARMKEGTNMTTPTARQHDMKQNTTPDAAPPEVQTPLTPQTPLIPTAPLRPGASGTAPASVASQTPVAPSVARMRTWNWSLRILGVVLALGGGLAVGYVASIMSFTSDVLLWAFVGGLVVWAMFVAALFQSFWAVILMPAISVVGLFVGSSIQNYSFDLQAWFTNGVGDIDTVVVAIIVPWMAGAFMGTPLGMWLKQRLRS